MAKKAKKAQTVGAPEEQAQNDGGSAPTAANSNPAEESKRTLSDTEEKLLRGCEETIDSGFKSSFQVGSSLQTILDQELYREDYTNFDEYCLERWGMSGSHARRLIGAAQVRSKLQDEFSPKGDKPLPLNEAQARPLTSLKPEQWVSTWEGIVEKSEEDDQTITAEFIEAFVSALAGSGKERKSKAKKATADKSSVAKTLMGYITKARKELKGGNTAQVVELLNKLRKFVREQFA